MLAQNPLFRAIAVLLTFWYVGLFVLSGFHGVAPWWVITLYPKSLLLAAIGMVAGCAFVLAAHTGARGITGQEVMRGSGLWRAKFSMGGPPTIPAPPRGEVPAKALEAEPWWPALKSSSPDYARAIRAVAATMMAMPRLPASPYPGGHGGRSLFEHSLAVATQTLAEARTWVYEGQKDKRGNIRVPLTDPDTPHRFRGADAPLLLLTGLAHDIGKMTCYEPDAGQDPKAPTGPLLRVTEVKRMHDAEGARILRRIPEVMALPLADRAAIFTAIGYYHHPFALPQAGWLTDRIRSLTELLAKADIAVGVAEGHTLLDADELATHVPDDVEEGGLAPVVNAGTLAMGAQLDAATLDALDEEDAEAEAMLKVAQAAAAKATPGKKAPSPAAAKPAAAKPAAKAATGTLGGTVPMELRLFMDAIREPGAINGKNRAVRIGWKHGDLVYVMDKVMRTRILNRGGADPLWAAEAMAEANGNAAPYTADLAAQLHERGALVTTFDGQEFSPARALFKMKMPSGTSVPVLIVQASAIPGASGIKDAEKPIEIVGPLWGSHSARNKKAAPTEREAAEVEPTAAAPAPAAAATVAAASMDLDDDDLPFAPTAPVPPEPEMAEGGSLADLDDDDLPFGLPPAPVGTAEPEPAQAEAAAPTDAYTLIVEIITSAEFKRRHSYEVREKAGAMHALIPLDSPAGEAVTNAVDSLREAGADVTRLKIATIGDTGQSAYVFTIG